MNWFESNAPIRLKLLIAFGSFIGLFGATALAVLVLPKMAAFGVALGAGGVALLLSFLYREAIARPYVATVVRMEGLAAGDLDTPIAFTEYRDCVGRLTKAMFTFREAAQRQIALNTEAEKHAAIVRGMAENFDRLSRGDLTADITEDYPAAYAALKTSFNAAMANLRDLLGSVTASTDNIRVGSQEIAMASEDLARRTEGNAASLEQTAAAVQEIDTRLKATAEAASRSVDTQMQAMTAVTEGRTRTDVAVQAMRRVSECATGIDDVIEGLDKIAFQTRVLAMNATVEAGRAGDAGLGFAVVADLVSALAMRAEEESKRARSQLSATQKEIGDAVDAVERVETAFSVIAASGEEAARLARQIASDNDAQADAIGQVNSAVGSMDESTQQNAAMVEQTSAAARNLTTEIAALAENAARFQIGKAASPNRVAEITLPARRPHAPIARGTRAVLASLAASKADHGDWSNF
jgi:methyl-accepting chemotaxis protein